PVGWAGDPDDCSKKYSYGGFGGKDSVLLKEYAQCRLARILRIQIKSRRKGSSQGKYIVKIDE
ncbi:MAG: hypothetical protein WAJ93_05500, partial [Candidatus Nitrosopolaris sp.]